MDSYSLYLTIAVWFFILSNPCLILYTLSRVAWDSLNPDSLKVLGVAPLVIGARMTASEGGITARNHTAETAMLILDDALAAIDSILFDDYTCFGSDYTLSGDNEWATELAIKGILQGDDYTLIAATIASEWEPSDDEMMSAFGTKWHDGL